MIQEALFTPAGSLLSAAAQYLVECFSVCCVFDYGLSHSDISVSMTLRQNRRKKSKCLFIQTEALLHFFLRTAIKFLQVRKKTQNVNRQEKSEPSHIKLLAKWSSLINPVSRGFFTPGRFFTPRGFFFPGTPV